MAGPEEQQQAHAAEIRALTEGRRADARSGGEPITRAEIQAMITAAEARIKAACKITIQNANDIIVTGGPTSFTIGRQPTQLSISATIDCSEDPPVLHGTITG